MTPALPEPSPSLTAVVVVPARDEAALIERCLRRLRSQRDVAAADYEILVVLDGCVDATPELVAALAREHSSPPLHVVELEASAGVGRARQIGMDVARDRLLACGRADGLIATTDADSVVAADWLAAQLWLRCAGARAIGGEIELDPDDAAVIAADAVAARERSAAGRMAALRAGASPGAPLEHHHFSGASLALTVEAYIACGGLPPRAALEDEALAQALGDAGIPIHRSRGVRVRTSARTQGRAPRGLAHDLSQADWRARRCATAADYPLERLLEAKRSSVALVLPAREVAATIGPIVATAVSLKREGLLDEVVVVDAASRDCSAAIAAAAGATVLQENELLCEFGPVRGKGDAMWRALAAVESDIVAFADSDSAHFDPGFITGLLGPLLCDRGVRFVKAAFRRPFRIGDVVEPNGGGRVTELLARPLLNLHAPGLTVFDQPLAGETAATRELLEQLPFSAGYGVEIAMLIDVWRLAGLDAMAQVDLGVRHNRHQSLRDLSAMAYAVLIAAESRLIDGRLITGHASERMSLAPRESGGAPESRAVVIDERPPLASLEGREISPLSLITD